MCRVRRTTSVTMSEEEPEVEVENDFELIENETIPQTIQRLTAMKNSPVDSIAHLINASINANPSSRILLMSARFLGVNVAGMTAIAHIRRQVHAAFPNTEFLDSSGRKKVNVGKYNSPLKYTNPYVVMMDISDRSNTAQGLDLYSTTLSIIAGDSRNDIKLQIIMRSSRMGLNNENASPRAIVNVI